MCRLRAGGASEEEGSFGILDGLGGFLGERALAASIAGFSGLSVCEGVTGKSLHLSQHGCVEVWQRYDDVELETTFLPIKKIELDKIRSELVSTRDEHMSKIENVG